MKITPASLIIIILLCTLVTGKLVRRKITLGQLSNAQTIFLTRFDFGTGEGNITLKYRKLGVQNVQLTNIKVGLLIDQNYQKFMNARTCRQKQQIYTETHRIKFYDAMLGTQIVRVNQNIREHLWYIYIYNCQDIQLRSRDGSQGIFFDCTLLNNGSHFGDDEGLLWPYVVLLVLWLVILVRKLFMPMMRAFLKYKTVPLEMFLYAGYLLIALAVFYKLLNLFMIYHSGQGLAFFDVLHGTLKCLAESGILVLLMAISWGWSLTHNEFKTKYKLIALGVSGLTIFNLTIWHMKQQIENSYHQYETASGRFVFISRVLMGIAFIIGCISTSASSVGKRKHFISKFKKLGAIYLFSWPVAVVVCELLLPSYLHNQVITIIQEYSHLLTNAYICWIFAYPDSEYKKVNLKKQDDDYLPDIRVKA